MPINSELRMTDSVTLKMISVLNPYVAEPNLVEVSVVKPGEVGLEIAGKGYEFRKAPELTYDYWVNLCHVLANKNGLVFHPRRQPRLSTALPGGHRFEAMVGKNVGEDIGVSIRVKRTIDTRLEAFGLEGDLKDRIIGMVEEGANIVISGGTSSGKTTFLNTLIKCIPKHKRVLTVEDTRELDIPHENRKHYIVSRNEASPIIGYQEVIDHLVRSRPDVIIAGEVSIPNAFPIVRILNSGHAGFMCTIHANTPALALDAAIPQNVRLSGNDASGVKDILYHTVDVALQLHRIGLDERRVTEVLFPKLGEHLVLVDHEGTA